MCGISSRTIKCQNIFCSQYRRHIASALNSYTRMFKFQLSRAMPIIKCQNVFNWGTLRPTIGNVRLNLKFLVEGKWLDAPYIILISIKKEFRVIAQDNVAQAMKI